MNVFAAYIEEDENMGNDSWRRDRIGSALKGQNPMVLTQMRSGFAVIGDTQFLPGYSLLLPNDHIGSLEELDFQKRGHYLLDASLLGEAVLTVCQARRVNYSIYGNTDAFLHTHIFPRYNSEPVERISRPVWDYPKDRWTDLTYAFDEKVHGQLKMAIKEEVERLMKIAY